MAANLFILSIAIAVYLANTAEAQLRCWKCSYNSSSRESFCDDPFNPNVLSYQEKRWTYVQCPQPPIHRNPNGKAYYFIPVCKKTVRNVYGNRVLSRSCHWVNNETPIGECLHTLTEKYIRTESCKTCTTDGCNSF